MKILIGYASKHGFARKYAQKLTDGLKGEIDMIDLKKNNNIEVNKYDKIILGGSIYVGQIQKEVKEFALKNKELLSGKKLGFFISCMQTGEEARKELEASFPQELLDEAAAKECFGGGFNFKDMGFMEKLMIKVIAKTNKDEDNTNHKNIENFIEIMNRD